MFFNSETLWKACFALLIALGCFVVGFSAGHQKAQKQDDIRFAPICEAIGSSWVEANDKGKPLPRGKWGRQCLAGGFALSKFKTDAILASNKLISDFQKDQAARTSADADRAASDNQAHNKANQDMETRNGKVQKDQVGADWFDGLNAVGGLRPSGSRAVPTSRRPKARKPAPVGVDDVR